MSKRSREDRSPSSEPPSKKRKTSESSSRSSRSHKRSKSRSRSRSKDRKRSSKHRSRSRDKSRRSKSRERHRNRSRSRSKESRSSRGNKSSSSSHEQQTKQTTIISATPPPIPMPLIAPPTMSQIPIVLNSIAAGVPAPSRVSAPPVVMQMPMQMPMQMHRPPGPVPRVQMAVPFARPAAAAPVAVAPVAASPDPNEEKKKRLQGLALFKKRLQQNPLNVPDKEPVFNPISAIEDIPETPFPSAETLASSDEPVASSETPSTTVIEPKEEATGKPSNGHDTSKPMEEDSTKPADDSFDNFCSDLEKKPEPAPSSTSSTSTSTSSTASSVPVAKPPAKGILRPFNSKSFNSKAIKAAPAVAPSSSGGVKSDSSSFAPSSSSSSSNGGSNSSKGATKTSRGDVFFEEETDMDYQDIDSDDERKEDAEKSGNSWLESRVRKKDLKQVDHSSVEYQSFRKNFYIEVSEITNMTHDEVVSLRESLDFIKVRGHGAIRPVTGFHQCGFPDKILESLKKFNYEKPTPIQAQALPIILSGRDVIGIAKTGSGKTLGFLLPMLRHIMDQPPVNQGEGPIGLIMVPTRELAMQIHAEAKKFCKRLGLRVVCVYGGAGVQHQIGDLKRGAEIVVCTPGRMIDILCTNSGRITNLHRVTFLVLDEADRMFDMGFEPQIMRIIQNTRPTRQTALFSATFPRVVEAAARKILTKPLEIVAGAISVVCSDVQQTIEVVSAKDKFTRLIQVIREKKGDGSVLIFVNQQDDCDEIFKRLMKANYPCLSLHGGKDQLDRDSTLDEFKKREVDILVATSVAARGLDVPSLNLVINFDCPDHYEDYVHRCGRTGRAGRKGDAVTFIQDDEERFAPSLVKALKVSKNPIPEKLQRLCDSFLEKKSQGKQQSAGNGFHGRGFKFDEAEEAERANAQKQQRKAWKVEDGDEDEEELATIKEVKDEPTGPSAPSFTPEQIIGAEWFTLPLVIQQTLTKLCDGSISYSEAEASILQYNNALMAQTAPQLLQQVAEQLERYKLVLNNLFTIINGSDVLGAAGATSDKTHFVSEIEINDYPQQTRWKVTHKGALDSIVEFTACAITPRGTFVPLGRAPPPGERKLYLLIEGPDENSVLQAKSEIRRMIEESTAIASGERETYGRYSVI